MKFIPLGLVALLVVCTISVANGQLAKNKDNILLPASSPMGNFVYLFNGNDLQDSALLANTDYFEIKRTKLTGGFDSAGLQVMEKTLTVVGNARKCATIKELKSFYTEKLIYSMKRVFKLKTDEALFTHFKKFDQPLNFFTFYFLIETRLALGHVFLDKDVKEGEAYLYYVYRIDKNKKRTFWGKTAIWSKIGNYKLNAFKPILASRQLRDSSLAIQWAVPLSVNLDTLAKPSKRLPFDFEGMMYNNFFYPTSIKAKLSLCVNDEWKNIEGIMNAMPNKTEDTLFFSFLQKQLPGDIVRASIQLEDEVHNQGNRSDTVNAFIITDKNAPRITRLNIRDTLNAIAISWTQLKQSPYLSGVQIIKYGSEDKGDTLALLPITDTIFIDYDIKIGINYRYEVRALYQPAMAVYQTIPSSGVATLLKLSRPAPPFNLKAMQEGKNIRLNWDVAKDPTIESFFIYRGITPTKLSLLPARVPCCTFLDTTMEMSGGSQYFYSVNCQNIKQDSSIYSNIVSIVPNRKLKISPPTDIHFYVANERLNLSWQDSRRFDNNIKGYLVEKRVKESVDSNFKLITPNFLNVSFFKDTAKVNVGLTYQYRTYSISYKGDTSDASEIFEWDLPKARVDVLDKFYVLPKPKTLTVSIPPVTYENRKSYKIFRRKEPEQDFKLIATIPATQFLYDDPDAERSGIYHYCIAIIHADGREGRRSMEYAITKN